MNLIVQLVVALAVVLFVYLLLDAAYISLYAADAVSSISETVTGHKTVFRKSAAVLFYLLGSACLAVLAVVFASHGVGAWTTAGIGLLVGLFAYMAYDLTLIGVFTGHIKDMGALYRFATLTPQGITVTREFGTCSDLATVTLEDTSNGMQEPRLTMVGTLDPEAPGHGPRLRLHHFVLRQGQVEELVAQP